MTEASYLRQNSGADQPGGGIDLISNGDAPPLGGAVPVGEAVPEDGTVPVAEGDGGRTVTEGDGGRTVTEGDGGRTGAEGDGGRTGAEGDGGRTGAEGDGGGGTVAPPQINAGDVGPLTATASWGPCFMARSADCVWITIDLCWY